MPKICLVTLGCAKNLVDAEITLGFLKRDGFELTTLSEESDVIIVNTCGFVEDSKRESIEKILEVARYKEEGRCRMLVVSGCLAQRYREDLAEEMPEVDLFVGTGEFDKISDFVKQVFGRSGGVTPPLQNRVVVSDRQILPDPDFPRIRSTPGHYAYLKISEGCSHSCSFCIIPRIRGGLKSRTVESIVREARQMVDEGVKEINLIAQDLNEYGRDLKDKNGLAGLLTALDGIEGNFWIRPLYMYPLEFNDRLIGVLRDGVHIVKYVDIPLQHISERVLLSMRRGSPSRYVRQLLSKLKQEIPDLALRTTFIVGYPGETEDEFDELCNFVNEVEFDRVGVFKYSMEEGTSAVLLPDQVPAEIKRERLDRLLMMQQSISRKKHSDLVGRSFRALIEKKIDGSSFRQARVAIQAPEIDGVTMVEGKAESGSFETVTITGAAEYDLFASVAQNRSASRGKE